MTPKDPRKLGEVLGTGPLAALAREAERRRQATAALRSRLPANEAAHLVSAATDESGTLVIVMDSPEWAARLRYRAAELGEPRVRVKVQPPGR